MPVLTNPRFERFAQGVAKGKSQHAAYQFAGYAGTDHSNAGKLARKPEIAARIAELQGYQAKRVGITVDALLAELDVALRMAHRVKAPGAAVNAIMSKAKLLGLVTDKVDVEATLRKPARRPTEETKMSLEDWKSKFSPPEVLQ